MVSTERRNNAIKPYDLHIHSTVSDGTLTPVEIIQLAVQSQIKGISITDHDDINAEELPAIAAEKGIIYIHGIEFSTTIPNLHIIGYGLDYDSKIIRKYIKSQKEEREKAMKEMCLRAQKNGMEISFNELVSSDSQTYGRPHLANLMIRKGYVKNIYEAFQRYLKDDKPVFVDYQKYHYLEILNIIQQSNGTPVLAHPGMLKHSVFHSVIYTAIKNGLKGIEVYYPRHSSEQIDRFKKIAKEYNLIISGGSDFHGDIKPDITIGLSGLEQDDFEKFIKAAGC